VDSLSQANKYVGINIETEVNVGFGFVLNHNAEQNNNTKATINQLHVVGILKINSRSASHKISHPSFYGSYSFITVFKKARQPLPIQNQMNPNYTTHPDLPMTHFITDPIHGKIPMRATCPVHLFILDLIIIIIFSEQCNLLLCIFLQNLVTSSNIGPNIPLSTHSLCTVKIC
jgi:hypothetical protein